METGISQCVKREDIYAHVSVHQREPQWQKQVHQKALPQMVEYLPRKNKALNSIPQYPTEKSHV
jgi:hypothetical protein